VLISGPALFSLSRRIRARLTSRPSVKPNTSGSEKHFLQRVEVGPDRLYKPEPEAAGSSGPTISKPFQLSGPDWLDSVRFDRRRGKYPADTKNEDRMLMLAHAAGGPLQTGPVHRQSKEDARLCSGGRKEFQAQNRSRPRRVEVRIAHGGRVADLDSDQDFDGPFWPS